MILYLHGFRSSPASFKARLLAQRMQDDGRATQWLCPQLPAAPAQAMMEMRALIQSLLQTLDRSQLCLIGSSLGGFYATALAEEFACRAVLLNPAVQPARDLAAHIGRSTAYHSDEAFEFKPEYIPQLLQYQRNGITQASRYFLLAATGDEVLDWREMVAHYAQAKQIVIQGSDHGLSDFAAYIDQVLAFALHAPVTDAGQTQ